MANSNDEPSDVQRWRAYMKRDAPDLLDGLEVLIAKYRLSDEAAFDLLFDADNDRQVGVPHDKILSAMAYDLANGIRPEK